VFDRTVFSFIWRILAGRLCLAFVNRKIKKSIKTGNYAFSVAGTVVAERTAHGIKASQR
jgi:hypothetical protein